MSDLSVFPITKRWPPRNPRAIQLYSLTTPNGAKVAIALEEMGLPYDAHRISFAAKDQFTPEFLSLNPNNKIPAIIDPDGPDGKPLPLFESGAILLYLAEKSGKLLPKDAAGRWAVIQWLMFQMGGIGPMFGQVGFFHHFEGKAIEDPRPRERYYEESRRLLGVMNRQLEGQDWIAGDYSIADIAIGPWLRNLRDVYKAADEVGLPDYPNVAAYLERFLARPAVQRGLKVPAPPQ
ncbi:MAG: glutathione S-transferase N-terminal domain-containing protein [Paracoccaceae bacterium]